MRRTVRRGAVLVMIGLLGMLVAAVGVAAARNSSAPAPATVSEQRQREITSAAAEFGVPAPLLLALAGALSGFGADADPAVDGGSGLFRLADRPAALDGRGGVDTRGERVRAAAGADPASRALARAAELADRSPAQVRDTPAEGARAAAALLRSYALEATGGTLPGTVVGWYGAVARFATGDAMTGRAVADDVYALLRRGVPATVVGGERFTVPADPAATLPAAPGGPATGECPAACRLVPAAGYAPANRTTVDTAVVSTAPAGYTATIAALGRASSRWSPHYVVRASDGAVTQTVLLRDAAWHTGDPVLDAGSVAIAVEADPGPAAYRSVGLLLRALAARGLAVDRQHVFGASEIAGSPVGLPADFDWARVLRVAGAPLAAEAFRADRVVTVAAPGLVLREAPAATAAALPGRPGVGRQLAVAERRGEWTAVWYGGRTAWFTDPAGTLTLPGGAERVSPAGASAVPVLGSPGGTRIGTLAAGQATVLLDPDAVRGHLLVGYGDTIGYVRSDRVTLQLG